MMKTSAAVLLAEDDENDIFFMELAFKKAGLIHPLMVVRNGEEAIHYLEAGGLYADHEKYPVPCLLLLDINMPILSGFDVLEWLQHQPQVRALVPVVVLTSSSCPSDIQRALALGAADYRLKPTHCADLVTLLRELQARWLTPDQSPGPVMAAQHSTLIANPGPLTVDQGRPPAATCGVRVQNIEGLGAGS